MTCDNCSLSREVIDVPADVGDETALDVRVEAPGITLMLRPLAEGVMVTLTGVILAFGLRMLIAVSIIVVLGAGIAFEVLVPAAYAIDVRLTVTSGALPDTIIVPVSGIGGDAFADVDAGV